MKTLLNLFVLLLMLAVISCGGGGSYAGGGSSGTGISSGSVTAFGSIFVNGVEFETAESEFTIDGETGKTQDDLKIGMVVTVQGSITGSTGNATVVVAEDVLEGPVDGSLPITANSMTVLGQTVQMDTNTIYDNSSLPNGIDDIVGGIVLEISGHVKADTGVIVATFIERKTLLPGQQPDYEVKGYIKGHNAAAQTFQVGSLTVDYSDPATITGDMPIAPPASWNDMFVEVKGNDLNAGTLTATKVEPEGLALTNADDAEVEGYVTTVGTNSFVLGNQSVEYDPNSVILEGGILDDIAPGVKLEVEGSLSNGVLTASTISFRDNVRLEADVLTVSVGPGTFTLRGLGSLTVLTDDLTEFKDGLTINTLDNRHLRIRGREVSINQVIATEIEDRGAASPGSRVILQGNVDTIVGSSLNLLGNTVNTASIPDPDGFKDVEDNIIGSTTFFSLVGEGTLIKARGDLSGASVIWDQVELEE